MSCKANVCLGAGLLSTAKLSYRVLISHRALLVAVCQSQAAGVECAKRCCAVQHVVRCCKLSYAKGAGQHAAWVTTDVSSKLADAALGCTARSHLAHRHLLVNADS